MHTLRPSGFNRTHEAIRQALRPAALAFVPVMGLIILIMGVTP